MTRNSCLFYFFSAGFLPISGGKLNTDFKLELANNNENSYRIVFSTGVTKPSFLNLYGYEYNSQYAGTYVLQTVDSTTLKRYQLIGKGKDLILKNIDMSGQPEYSLSDIAIVNKSITKNGYILFNCGLTFQWGEVSVNINNTYGWGVLPINFQNEHFSITGNCCYVDQYVVTRPVSIEILNLSTVKVAINPAISEGGIYIKYIAIGY